MKQGSLDGLCGLYSIINAIALAAHHEQPLTEPQCERLFASGGWWLQRRRLLADALANGITTRAWGELAGALVRKHRRDTGIKLTIEVPLARRRSPSAAVIRAAIEDALAAGCPVLLSLDGTYDHFTVATSFSSSRLGLFDSCDGAWVCWSSIGGATARHHITRAGLIMVCDRR